MKIVEVENNRYELIDNYKDGFDMNEFISHYTDFFSDYDYIVGDIAYGKLRLKGFYDEANKKAKDINNYKYFDKCGFFTRKLEITFVSESIRNVLQDVPLAFIKLFWDLL